MELRYLSLPAFYRTISSMVGCVRNAVHRRARVRHGFVRFFDQKQAPARADLGGPAAGWDMRGAGGAYVRRAAAGVRILH